MKNAANDVMRSSPDLTVQEPATEVFIPFLTKGLIT